MYVANGVAYADERTIKVMSVRSMCDYKLWIRFSNGEERLFDFTPLLDMPCFIALRDEALFKSVYVDYGTSVWRDGEIDISPERLYREGVKI